MEFSEKDLNKVMALTKEIDSAIVDIIERQLNKAHADGDIALHLAAVINSLSYCLGRSIADLCAMSTQSDIHTLVVASGKIVNQGITDSNKELQELPKYIN